MEVAEELQKESIHIAGNSAYALAVFLLTPYDNAAPKSIEGGLTSSTAAIESSSSVRLGN